MSATTPGSITDKRLAIDMTALRQELWRGENEEIGDHSSSPTMPIDAKDQLIWICTVTADSDQLTKSMRWDAVRNLCATGCFPLTVTPGRAGFQSCKTQDCEKLCITSMDMKPRHISPCADARIGPRALESGGRKTVPCFALGWGWDRLCSSLKQYITIHIH